MAIVATIIRPGAALDAELGIEGIGELGGALGLDPQIREIIDRAAAARIRDGLEAEGIAAELYTTDNPPARSSRSSLITLFTFVAVGFALARIIK